VTSTIVPGDREQAAISAASARCVCQEEDGSGPCGCPVPVTREQVGRLHAYAGQHPERAFIMSELEGAWMSALADFLPPGDGDEDRVLAWMSDPCALPPDADLRSSSDLGKLLDMLGAPPPAAQS